MKEKILKSKNPFLQCAKVNKFIQLTVHLKAHLMEYKEHNFDLTQTNITIVTVNYIVLGSQNFSENVNVWEAVLQKPYNMELRILVG